MAGVYCHRCQTNVILEQDGRSCSNCGTVLVQPYSPQPPEPEKTPAKKRPAKKRS